MSLYWKFWSIAFLLRGFVLQNCKTRLFLRKIRKVIRIHFNKKASLYLIPLKHPFWERLWYLNLGKVYVKDHEQVWGRSFALVTIVKTKQNKIKQSQKRRKAKQNSNRQKNKTKQNKNKQKKKQNRTEQNKTKT